MSDQKRFDDLPLSIICKRYIDLFCTGLNICQHFCQICLIPSNIKPSAGAMLSTNIIYDSYNVHFYLPVEYLTTFKIADGI